MMVDPSFNNCVVDFKNKIPLTAHHLLLIFGLFMFTNYYTQDIPKKTLLAMNYLTELSTPFLNKTIMLYNQTILGIKMIHII